MATELDIAFFDHLWDDVLLMMQERFDTPTFETWFTGTKIVDYDPSQNLVTVFVPSSFSRNWIDSHYTSIIENAMIAMTELDLRVSFSTDSSQSLRKSVRTATGSSHAVDQSEIHPPTPTHPRDLHQDSDSVDDDVVDSPLNEKYTFDTFVIGVTNRFAHAACLAVAETPAQAYNPLFIYGGVGLGKTHLLHAIAHNVRNKKPFLRVLYLSTERFTNEFIVSIRDNTTGQFRNKYRNIDVLLIDDIQFLAKKEQTQEEFFHTFNALHEAGKQIVITSDCPPREIPTLEDRLRSRFEWGLITDIQPPDLETRIAILQRKAKAGGFHISSDVMNFIASQVESNIRELEGALIRVIAYSSLVNEDISVELASQALKDIIRPSQPNVITVSQIQKVVGDHFGIKTDDIQSKSRSKTVVYPRQIAMYLTRGLTDLSLPKIGEAFGGRDHTTVMHACDKISSELKANIELQRTIESLSDALRNLY